MVEQIIYLEVQAAAEFVCLFGSSLIDFHSPESSRVCIFGAGWNQDGITYP